MLNLVRLRCCKTWDDDDDCDAENYHFCIEGLVNSFDPQAEILWHDAFEFDLQQTINTQYILRGDRCGCSQAADLSDRALAEANGLNAALPFDIVSSRYGLTKTRDGMDDFARDVHVVDSTYGLEAACLSFDTWFGWLDGVQELRKELIEIDRVDQVAMYFPLITDRTVTRSDVLSAITQKLYGTVDVADDVARGFAETTIAKPRREDPEPIAIYQNREGGQPAVAVVTLSLEAPMYASALEAGSMCMRDDLRAQLVEASSAAVQVTTLFDQAYVANIDGFQALSKASSAGTGEFQMVTTFAIRLISRTNSKSTQFVLPICLFPGDDNRRNWQHVMQADRIDEQMETACRKPKLDPLHPTNSLVHCNAGWVIDSKAASNQIGQGSWISSLPNPCGVCTCSFLDIVNGLAADATCLQSTRPNRLADALKELTDREAVEAAGTPLESKDLVAGKLADLAQDVRFFALRAGNLAKIMYHPLARVPVAAGAIENAIALYKSLPSELEPGHLDPVLGALRLAETQLAAFVSGGKVLEGNKLVTPLPINVVGSGQPLKTLKCCLGEQHGSVSTVIAAAETLAADATEEARRGLGRELERLDRGSCARKFEAARVAEYWKKSKHGDSARLDPGGPVQTLMRFLQKINPIISMLVLWGLSDAGDPRRNGCVDRWRSSCCMPQLRARW